MKVVLFCGGQGMRLRDYSQDVPKPLVELLSRDEAPWQVWRRCGRNGHELREAREHPTLLEQAR